MTDPTPPADDRVVLGWRKAHFVALSWCLAVCRPDRHEPECLIPDFTEQEQLLATPDLGRVVLPDCRDGKHAPACPGCACDCHRHHNRPGPDPLVPSPS